MKDRLKKVKSIVERPLAFYDIIIFIVLAISCYFSFFQGDILHTAGSSIAYLNGRFLDFYDYNVQYVGGNAYLPSTYILFAVWNLPLKLFNLVTVPALNFPFLMKMWFKLLPTLFYMASGIMVYKIATQMSYGELKAKLCAYIFLTTPIAFFSQFIFGQYDSFTVFFVLLGMYFYLCNKQSKFVIFFGIAITFKYFALLIFVPMLLLREKRVKNIFYSVFLVFMPFFIEVAFYIQSSAFKDGIFGFGATNFLFLATFNIRHTSIIIFIVLWLFVCAWSYFTEPEDKTKEYQWLLFFDGIIIFLIFGISMWHPQWLMFAVPFMVLSTAINKKTGIFLMLDLLMMLFFVGFTVNAWKNGIDQTLLQGGVLGVYAGDINKQDLSMSSIFLVKDLSIWYSCVSALFLINAIFKYPKYCENDFSKSINESWGVVRARFVLGVALFAVPAYICLIGSFFSPILVLKPSQSNISIGPIINHQQTGQVFVAGKELISKIKVYFGIENAIDQQKFIMQILNFDTKKILFEKNIDLSELTQDGYLEIDVPEISVDVGREYVVLFKTHSTSEDNYITIYRNGDSQPEVIGVGYAVIGDDVQPYDLMMEVYGR